MSLCKAVLARFGTEALETSSVPYAGCGVASLRNAGFSALLTRKNLSIDSE
jgi:hypothetical protein